MPAAPAHSLKACRVFLRQGWCDRSGSRNGKDHELIHGTMLMTVATDRWAVSVLVPIGEQNGF